MRKSKEKEYSSRKEKILHLLRKKTELLVESSHLMVTFILKKMEKKKILQGTARSIVWQLFWHLELEMVKPS